MDKSTRKSASKVDAASVITAPKEPLEKGKREAEDVVEKEVVSAKKQKVEEENSEFKNEGVVKEKVENSKLDTSSFSESEQQTKVMVCTMEGHIGSVLADESSGLEDASAAKKKPAGTAKSVHVAAPEKRDELSDTSGSFSREGTNTVEDIIAIKKAPASLTIEGPITLAKKTDVSSSEDKTNVDDDIAPVKEAHTAPSTRKSEVSTLKKDESESDDWTITSHLNASVAEKKPAAPTKVSPVNTTNSKNKDDSSFDDVSFYEDDFTPKNISAPVTSKKDQCIEDSKSDNKLINDPKTSAVSSEQTTGPKTLYVGNLSFSVEQEDVEHFFKAAGEIVGIRFGMNPDESFRGFGFVEFSSAEAAEKALHELNGKELLRRPVKLDLLRERGPYTPYSGKNTQSFQKGERPQGQRIFVRGFNKFDGEDKIKSSLKEHFGSCGEITGVSLPTDQDGAVKGIALIFFKDSDACSRALELNGSEFGGSTLLVEEARSRHDSSGSGSARGWRSDGAVGGRSGGWDSTLSVEEARPRHVNHDTVGSVGDRGWRSGGWDIGGRCGGWDSSLSVEEARPRNGGNGSGHRWRSGGRDSTLSVEEARSRHDSHDRVGTNSGRGWRNGGWDSTFSVEEARPRLNSRDSGGSGSGRGWRSCGLEFCGRSHEVGFGGKRIFVRGFNKFDGEDKIRSSLKEHFGSCGEITRVSLPTDHDGAVKGIAFIFFKDSDACSRALELNGYEFGGTTLLVEEARSGHDTRDSGGSGGGRGWRSGGWDLGRRCDGAGFDERSGGRGFGDRSGGRGFGGRSGGGGGGWW